MWRALAALTTVREEDRATVESALRVDEFGVAARDIISADRALLQQAALEALRTRAWGALPALQARLGVVDAAFVAVAVREGAAGLEAAVPAGALRGAAGLDRSARDARTTAGRLWSGRERVEWAAAAVQLPDAFAADARAPVVEAAVHALARAGLLRVEAEGARALQALLGEARFRRAASHVVFAAAVPRWEELRADELVLANATADGRVPALEGATRHSVRQRAALVAALRRTNLRCALRRYGSGEGADPERAWETFCEAVHADPDAVWPRVWRFPDGVAFAASVAACAPLERAGRLPVPLWREEGRAKIRLVAHASAWGERDALPGLYGVSSVAEAEAMWTRAPGAWDLARLDAHVAHVARGALAQSSAVAKWLAAAPGVSPERLLSLLPPLAPQAHLEDATGPEDVARRVLRQKQLGAVVPVLRALAAGLGLPWALVGALALAEGNGRAAARAMDYAAAESPADARVDAEHCARLVAEARARARGSVAAPRLAAARAELARCVRTPHAAGLVLGATLLEWDEEAAAALRARPPQWVGEEVCPQAVVAGALLGGARAIAGARPLEAELCAAAEGQEPLLLPWSTLRARSQRVVSAWASAAPLARATRVAVVDAPENGVPAVPALFGVALTSSHAHGPPPLARPALGDLLRLVHWGELYGWTRRSAAAEARRRAARPLSDAGRVLAVAAGGAAAAAAPPAAPGLGRVHGVFSGACRPLPGCHAALLRLGYRPAEGEAFFSPGAPPAAAAAVLAAWPPAGSAQRLPPSRGALPALPGPLGAAPASAWEELFAAWPPGAGPPAALAALAPAGGAPLELRESAGVPRETLALVARRWPSRFRLKAP